MKIIRSKVIDEYQSTYLEFKLEEQDAHLKYLADPSLETEHDWRTAQLTLLYFLDSMADRVLF